MLSANRKSAVIVLLGIIGLWASSAGAAPRLLFLGISGEGQTPPQAENAVLLRLAGFDVSLIRPKEATAPACDRSECLAAARAREQADVAIGGSILKSEHACLGILWLVAGKDKDTPVEQTIPCRSDARDDELIATMADESAAMVEGFLRSAETLSPQAGIAEPIATEIKEKPSAIKSKRLSWKRKLLIGGLSVLIVGGIAGSVALAIAPSDSFAKNNQTALCLSLFSIGLITSSVLAGSMSHQWSF